LNHLTPHLVRVEHVEPHVSIEPRGQPMRRLLIHVVCKLGVVKRGVDEVAVVLVEEALVPYACRRGQMTSAESEERRIEASASIPWELFQPWLSFDELPCGERAS
jgi:hypothetical protein